jgi:hypothetical protein
MYPQLAQTAADFDKSGRMESDLRMCCVPFQQTKADP